MVSNYYQTDFNLTYTQNNNNNNSNIDNGKIVALDMQLSWLFVFAKDVSRVTDRSIDSNINSNSNNNNSNNDVNGWGIIFLLST